MRSPRLGADEEQRVYAGLSALERRADRRERLLDAGLHLYGTFGYANSSIERICTTAAVSTRNFYQEFGGREPLLLALHDRIMERATRSVAEALVDHRGAPVGDRIQAGFRAYVRSTSGDPRWTRLVYVEVIGVSRAVDRNRAAWRERCADLLLGEAERAASGGAVRRDLSLTGIAVVGAVHELVHHWSLQPDRLPLDAVIAELATLVEAAVAFRPN